MAIKPRHIDRPTGSVQESIFWFLDRTQEVVIGSNVVVILYTRSPGVIYFTAGAIGTTLVAKFLKRVFRKPRPAETTRKLTYGMPSTHSAAISFYVTYITVASLCLPSRGPFTSIPKILPPIIFIPWASSVACSRIWLGYHTGAQVIAGVSVGVVTALVWFKLWTSGADVIVTDIVHRILALIPFL